MYYFLLTIAYDGTDFSGWAKQKNKSTIQGELEKAFLKVAPNSELRLVGASKTDAGVHAFDQKVWVELSFSPNISGFLLALNKTLPIGIKIVSMSKINKEYRVRNCKYKIYKYSISNDNLNILKNRFYVYIPKQLSYRIMKKALSFFVGKHNFINFSGLTIEESKIINTVRTIQKISFIKKKNNIYIYFKAKGFIRYQIRMIMGAVIAVGLGKINLDNIKDVLDLKKIKLPYKAEAKGLALVKVVNYN
ncbi:tRNA pseudouridine synthase A [Spiroplasma corruscae]|uniref:tRNA pseudouridine synthase A n=1 Tax=Spiroplasma corruscae TaxID=216934 RepID=A0A222EQM0_9MOLU|nr:tRNA pseudouridine(38-40) synthase TruA [Spiroplasma corruscae]ASP28681.1 tRNA pseudouridine synthase A [Spiroplasma corruscae]